MISDDDVVEQPRDEPSRPAPPPAPASPAPGRSLVLPLVLVVLLLAAVVVGVLQFAAAGDAADDRDELQAVDDDERDARLVAAQFAEVFLAYDFNRPEASNDAVLALVTDEYAATYQANRVPGVTELFADTQLVSSGEAQDVYLTPVSDSSAKAVVVLDLSLAVGSEARTVEDFTLFVELQRQGGEWRVDSANLPNTRILGADGEPLGQPTATTARRGRQDSSGSWHCRQLPTGG